MVDLASRGRAVEQPEPVPEAEPEKLRASPMTTEDPIVTSTPNETAGTVETAPVAVKTDPAVGDNAGVAANSVDDKTNSSVAPEPEDAIEAVAATRPKRSKQRQRSKSKVQNVALATGVAYEAANSEPGVPPIPFVDEVVALDEDIRKLRRQLAGKLSLQNAQLKKMLERF